MKIIYRAIVALIAALAVIGLSGCAELNKTQEVIEQVQSLEYTGDPQTDLKSLCSLSMSINALNNEQRESVNGVLTATVNLFSEQSDDNRVKNAAKFLEMSTSADASIRAEGESQLKNLCSKL